MTQNEENENSVTPQNSISGFQNMSQPSQNEDSLQFSDKDPTSEIKIVNLTPVEVVSSTKFIPLKFEIKTVFSELRRLNLKFLRSNFQNISKSEMMDKLAQQKYNLIELVFSFKEQRHQKTKNCKKKNAKYRKTLKVKQPEQHENSKKSEDAEIDFNLEFNKRLEDFHYTHDKDQLNSDLSFLLNCQPEYKTKKIISTNPFNRRGSK